MSRPGNRDVSIDPPSARIATALSVKLNGADLEPTSIKTRAALYTNWQSKTGTPTRYWIDERHRRKTVADAVSSK